MSHPQRRRAVLLLAAGCQALAAPALVAAQADADAAAASTAAHSLCVDVDGGSRASYLDCLSAQLAEQTQAEADARRASLDAVTAAALPSSPSGQGLYNQAATREVLGSAFGTGVRRPPSVTVYTNPLQPKR